MNANVRTFRARDARAALTAVRAAFGGEAVILQTREIAGGVFGPAQIEVTAASSMDEAPRHDASRVRKAAFEEVRPSGKADPSDLQAEVASLRRVVEELRRRSVRQEIAGDDAAV